MKIRRRSLCFIEIANVVAPNFKALLEGVVKIEESTGVNLLCLVSGRRISISSSDLIFLTRLNPGWIDCNSLDLKEYPMPKIKDLVDRSVLLSDAEDDLISSKILKAENDFEKVGWHPLASLYHGMGRWSGVRSDAACREHGDAAHQERLRINAVRNGPLPTHFPFRTDALSEFHLPCCEEVSPLEEVLHARKTTRHFNSSKPLDLLLFSRVMKETFGALGVQDLAPGMTAMKRSSPSGGALHPIEAYPLVINVEGLESGWYHYRSDINCLSLLKKIPVAEVRELANNLVIGQTYFADAHVIIFHVARLDRHHWKYRRHPKGYKAVVLDSGHLSQTFYLLATSLGLGAFYTAAINDADVEKCLSLESPYNMVIGANGLGVIDPSSNMLHLQPVPLGEN